HPSNAVLGLGASCLDPGTKSILYLPLGVWEMRSTTKAVLESRWCTCSWARDFLLTLKAWFVENTWTRLAHDHSFVGNRTAELAGIAQHHDEDLAYSVFSSQTRSRSVLYPRRRGTLTFDSTPMEFKRRMISTRFPATYRAFTTSPDTPGV
ncbi:hypothetical protein CLAIMM_12917, partial [Cladophialophora immunda]